MANLVIVVGDTGTGKSTSLRSLDPKETFVVNVLSKPLPFKGSKGLYNEEAKNLYSTASYEKIITLINQINEKAPHIKHLILDDIGFVMLTEFFDSAAEKGYDKFARMGLHMQQIISTAKACRDDLNIVMMFHEDDDTSDRVKVAKKVKLIGQMLEDKYNPLALVSICLFTNVSFDPKTNQPVYSFITNRTSVNGITIPAKSPDGMFDDIRVPNDLKLVFERVENFYK